MEMFAGNAPSSLLVSVRKVSRRYDRIVLSVRVTIVDELYEQDNPSEERRNNEEWRDQLEWFMD
jgi:hypothetical protein